MGRYFGKVCEKHPDLSGARLESSGKCVRCHGDRVLALKKTPKQRERTREYLRAKERKGGEYYEAKKARNKRWYEKNKSWRREANLRRKGLGGTWPQFMEDVKAIYEATPDGFHVDHVVPLKGIDRATGKHVVCGLHVPWNLQYLSGEENDRKGAWFES